jgi:phosphoglycolate phosphatase-like HAD superfamily hydrolase
MRRALVAMDEPFVFDIVDQINLVGVKLPAVVAVPLKGLQKKHDLATFAAGAPIDAVSGLLELLSMEGLERIIDLLGDHAENPNFDQLKAASDAYRGEGGTRNDLIAVLAFAAGQEFPAAPSCRQLLDQEADLQLPALTITVGTTSLLSPKEQDAAVLEQRRLRREEEKAKKKAKADKAAAVKSSLAKKVKTEKKVAPSPAPTPRPLPTLEVTRRSVMLTPAEAATFDPGHPLATLRAAGGLVARSVMVGDHHNDIEAAAGAGIPAIWAAYGYGVNVHAQASVAQFSDLPDAAEAFAP